MAKFYGPIGFAETQETAPDVWRDLIVERNYSGDVLANVGRWQAGQQLNDNLNVDNRISIVADPYAVHHFHTIKYVGWMGAKWKVSRIEVEFPRLILTIGDLYNGEESSDE